MNSDQDKYIKDEVIKWIKKIEEDPQIFEEFNRKVQVNVNIINEKRGSNFNLGKGIMLLGAATSGIASSFLIIDRFSPEAIPSGLVDVVVSDGVASQGETLTEQMGLGQQSRSNLPRLFSELSSNDNSAELTDDQLRELMEAFSGSIAMFSVEPLDVSDHSLFDLRITQESDSDMSEEYAAALFAIWQVDTLNRNSSAGKLRHIKIDAPPKP